MVRFDFIESAAAGYRFLITERRAIYQMALVPFLIKLASFLGITALGLESNFLRQGLILLPSYFAEGWLIASLIRLAVLGERWPSALSGDQKRDEAMLAERLRSLQSSMVIYVLIKMAMTFASGTALEIDATYQQTAMPAVQPSPVIFLGALAALGLMIWSFRLLWLYVPAALGRSVTDFLIRIKPFTVSFQMMAAWLLCFVPVALALLMVIQILLALFPAGSDQTISPVFTYVFVILQVLVELVVSIISSVAMAYGISNIYKEKP